MGSNKLQVMSLPLSLLIITIYNNDMIMTLQFVITVMVNQD